MMEPIQKLSGNARLAIETVVVVAVLVVIRGILWAAGLDGMSVSPLASSIVAGGIFVMGLLIAGTLSDYKDAERAPTDLASGLYAILREAEAMNGVWGTPDMTTLRKRLVSVVTSLRADINAGNTRTCQAAVEDLSESFLELENTDVPANYVVRLRQEQAGLRKSLLRVYHIQHEQFLPSAYTLIVAMILVILTLVMFTNFGGRTESLVTVGFLSFFFLSLLRLLNVIDTPFKVGLERTDDDVSLFLLNEFVVQAQAGDAGTVVENIEEQAQAVEEQLADVEHGADDAAKAAEDAASAVSTDN
jgi:hypothetical protein